MGRCLKQAEVEAVSQGRLRLLDGGPLSGIGRRRLNEARRSPLGQIENCRICSFACALPPGTKPRTEHAQVPTDIQGSYPVDMVLDCHGRQCLSRAQARSAATRASADVRVRSRADVTSPSVSALNSRAAVLRYVLLYWTMRFRLGYRCVAPDMETECHHVQNNCTYHAAASYHIY